MKRLRDRRTLRALGLLEAVAVAVAVAPFWGFVAAFVFLRVPLPRKG